MMGSSDGGKWAKCGFYGTMLFIRPQSTPTFLFVLIASLWAKLLDPLELSIY
jgi:hypothetical protein